MTIVGLLEAAHSTMAGPADVFGIFYLLAGFDDAIPPEPPFEVTIAGADEKEVSRTPFRVDATIDEVQRTDIVIVPPLATGSRAS